MTKTASQFSQQQDRQRERSHLLKDIQSRSQGLDDGRGKSQEGRGQEWGRWSRGRGRGFAAATHAAATPPSPDDYHDHHDLHRPLHLHVPSLREPTATALTATATATAAAATIPCSRHAAQSAATRGGRSHCAAADDDTPLVVLRVRGRCGRGRAGTPGGGETAAAASQAPPQTHTADQGGHCGGGGGHNSIGRGTAPPPPSPRLSRVLRDPLGMWRRRGRGLLLRVVRPRAHLQRLPAAQLVRRGAAVASSSCCRGDGNSNSIHQRQVGTSAIALLHPL